MTWLSSFDDLHFHSGLCLWCQEPVIRQKKGITISDQGSEHIERYTAQQCTHHALQAVFLLANRFDFRLHARNPQSYIITVEPAACLQLQFHDSNTYPTHDIPNINTYCYLSALFTIIGEITTYQYRSTDGILNREQDVSIIQSCQCFVLAR